MANFNLHKNTYSTFKPPISFTSNRENTKTQDKITLPKLATGAAAAYAVRKSSQAIYKHQLTNLLTNTLKKFPTILTRNEAEPLFKKMLSENNLGFIKKTYIDNATLQKNIVNGYKKTKEYRLLDKLPEFLKPIGKKIQQVKINQLSKIINTGDYFSGTNHRIRINSDHLNAGFHEIGHAKDYFGKGFKLITSRTAPIIRLYSERRVLPALFLTCLTYKKSDNDEGSNIFKKTRAFIHNNIGKITFATGIPTMINEFSASKNALDFLKNSNKLNPSQLSLFKLRYGIGLGSYLAVFAGLGLCAKLGIMVRDKITGQS